MSTEDILAERGKTHGSFPEQATLSQRLKELLLGEGRYRFNTVQAEGLEMIAVKLSRIVIGNPNEGDHWADIAGYARLVADHLERMAKKPDGEDDFRHSPCPECVECGAYEGEMHLPNCPTQHVEREV